MPMPDTDGVQGLPDPPTTAIPSPRLPRELLCAATKLHALIDTLSLEAQQALLRTLELLMKETPSDVPDDT